MNKNSAHPKAKVRETEDPRTIGRIWRRIRMGVLRSIGPLMSQERYMANLVGLLREYGMQIEGNPIYISSKCWFDGTDYSLITIGDQVVISSYVSVLIHDFSIARVRDALAGKSVRPEVAIVKPIRIGRNSFVGRGALLMPGTDIGENCIVGAGSVVRGKIPDNSIVIGNPAKIVGNSLEWGERKLEEMGL